MNKDKAENPYKGVTKNSKMKKILFFLGIIIWLPSFIIACMAFGRLIDLSNFQEIVIACFFVGSIILMKKNDVFSSNHKEK